MARTRVKSTCVSTISDRSSTAAATVYLWFAFWSSHVGTYFAQRVASVAMKFITINERAKEDPYSFLKIFQRITPLMIVKYNPFWGVNIINPMRVPGGTILMSNHLCYADSWIIAAEVWNRDYAFAAMGSLFRIPIFGSVMRDSGHFPVEFAQDEEGNWSVANKEELMIRSRKFLQQGGILVVFPEGGMSSSGELQDFKKGYFMLAKETGFPIQTIAMWGNHDIFPPGDHLAAAKPGTIDLKYGARIDPNEFESCDSLREGVRQHIKDLTASLPRFKQTRGRSSRL